jgi:hypothetical protein
MADPSCWVIGGWGQDTLSPACLEPRCEMEGQFGVTYPGYTAAAERKHTRAGRRLMQSNVLSSAAMTTTLVLFGGGPMSQTC